MIVLKNVWCPQELMIDISFWSAVSEMLVQWASNTEDGNFSNSLSINSLEFQELSDVTHLSEKEGIFEWLSWCFYWKINHRVLSRYYSLRDLD